MMQAKKRIKSLWFNSGGTFLFLSKKAFCLRSIFKNKRILDLQ